MIKAHSNTGPWMIFKQKYILPPRHMFSMYYEEAAEFK
jgi:hypothetical protein